VAGLDVGSALIKVVVARARRPGLITGAGVSVAAGISPGEIYDPRAAARSVAEALAQAAGVSRAKIKRVSLGISGWGVQVFDGRARIVFKEKREIYRKDPESLLKMAGNLQLPAGRRVIQVVPQEFWLDGLVTAKLPIGLVSGCLECRAKVVTADRKLIDKLTSFLDILGIRVARLTVNVLAAAGVTLGETEKQLGVALFDLGSSTTGAAVFRNGVLLQMDVLPVGGAHVTSDLAIGLGTSLASAESLKKQVGLNGGPEYKGAVGIIRARIEEMFAMLKEKIVSNNLLPCGIVLTGGGALLKGLPEAAAEYFGVSVRVGTPRVNRFPAGTAPDPIWCASVGLTAGEQN